MRPLILVTAALGFLVSCQEANDGNSQDVLAIDSSIKSGGENIEVAAECQDSGNVHAKCDSKVLPEEVRSLADVSRRLKKKVLHFVVRTNRDTVLKCKEGTLLAIPANAFLNARTRTAVAGEVKVSVKEFYAISDMLLAGLTTKSNDRLLETGGMIDIKVIARESRDTCVLKPGISILIAMPSAGTSDVAGMQLFNGVHDSSTINWIPRTGIAGFAQNWRSGRDNFSQEVFQLRAGFVFPDEVPVKKPVLIKSEPEDLQAEIVLSVRDLMQNTGLLTKKVSAYIDTSGNLCCYSLGNSNKQALFYRLYEPMQLRDVKVNVAVEVNLRYRSPLNHEYFDKLFKMAKANPDSLVAVTVTLIPTVKYTSLEKIKRTYNYAVTVTEFKREQRRRALLMQEYDKRVRQFRMTNEELLSRSEARGITNLLDAQNYFLLSTSKLGWINCDRFYDAEKVDYLVKLKEKASMLIVFNSIKSIVASDCDGMFHGVPVNEKITIVGIKTEGGKLMMAMHETRVTKEPFERLRFEPVTIKEYKARLEKLNRM